MDVVYVWFVFNKGDALNRFTRLKGFFAISYKRNDAECVCFV